MTQRRNEEKYIMSAGSSVYEKKRNSTSIQLTLTAGESPSRERTIRAPTRQIAPPSTNG